MWFKAYHEFDHGKTLDVSNYRAKSAAETCKGCGLCVKRCPMEAIVLEASEGAKNRVGKISVINPEVCIGCGLCAYKCPTKSITLEQREEITEPPADTGDFVGRFLRDLSDPLPRRNG